MAPMSVHTQSLELTAWRRSSLQGPGPLSYSARAFGTDREEPSSMGTMIAEECIEVRSEDLILSPETSRFR